MPASVATAEEAEVLGRRLDLHTETLDVLDERVAALESQPGPATPQRYAPRVGIYVGHLTETPDYAARWEERQRAYGPVRLRRCYNKPILPAADAAYNDVADPDEVPVYSVKPGDRARFVAGEYAEQFKALVAGMPDGSYLAVQHEPEDDMTGDEFYALTARAFADAKEANPAVRFMYSAMAHQWGVDGHTTDPSGWLAAAKLCDLVTVDVYAPTWDFHAMVDDAGFGRWWNEIVVPSGKPWGVSERGISPHAGPGARVEILQADWAFARQHGAEMFLYYDVDWSGGDWRLRHPSELFTFGQIAAAGR